MAGFKNKLRARTCKAHVLGPVDAAGASAWYDFVGFIVIAEETAGGVVGLDNDTKTFHIYQTGYYKFGGCVHIKDNGGGGFNNLTVLMRVMKNGTTEARCSQRGFNRDIKGSGEDILSYNGTDHYNVGDTVTLQYYVSNADVDFDSNDTFSEQVACTIWFNYLGA